jgi:hypothetical protein
MQLLFDRRGNYIAYVDCGRLHSLSGANIGHYRSGEGVFIDRAGRYLGEVVLGKRLMFRVRSPHRDSQFAVAGDFGSAGCFGNPGSVGAAGRVAGYRDVALERLV